MLQFFGYDKCSTCREAKKFLKTKGLTFEDIDITQQPPSRKVFLSLLESGQYRMPELFNRSGQMYRDLKMKEKINTLSEKELLDLLTQHGKLVKRPVIIDGKKATVGFGDNQKKVWS